MTSRFIWLLCGLLLAASPAKADVFTEIDARFQRHGIDAWTRHYLRVLAVRSPLDLPADLRALAPAPTRRSHTGVLVDAFQWVARNGDEGGEIQALLAPLDEEFTMSLDSTQIPLRVSFNTGHESYARGVLDAAETSWIIQTEEFGFYEPQYERADGPYRVYITSANGAAGYCAPYAKNPDTPHYDCYTYIVIDPNIGNQARYTVAHEMNHAMQAAMDCAESTAYWENTSMYIEQATFPASFNSALAWLPTFQDVPWRGLDWFARGEGYPYGGILLNLYLADAFATPDTGPVLIRRIWEASMQDDRLNSVTYFDGIEKALNDQGDAVTFEEVFLDFSEARYFVGGADDGAHIDGAGGWGNGALHETAFHYLSSLPLGDKGVPDEYKWPEPAGSNHIIVNLSSSTSYPLRVVFDGDDAVRWSARVLRLSETEPATGEDLVLDPETWSGELVFDPQGRRRVMLVVTNHGPEGYAPGHAARTPRSYRYDFHPIIPAPTITAMEPAQLEAGQQNVTLVLTGEGFMGGWDFGVRFLDPSIQVEMVLSVQPTQVRLVVTVPQLTEPGIKSVAVTNHGGAESAPAAVLEIVVPPSGGGGGGCPDCRTGGTGGGLPLLVVLGWLWIRRRRSRAGNAL